MREIISYKRAVELFSYDEATGDLIPNGTCCGRITGTKAGSLDTSLKGYQRWRVTADGRTYQASRLIWFIKTGVWPNTIDHINGNSLDNRWQNLRNVNQK